MDCPQHDPTPAVFVDCNLTDAHFTAEVITGAAFHACVDDPATVDRVKSTCNYKHGHMEGIRLPDELREALRGE